MRSPRDFFKPLAVGAPEPIREIPFRPSRVIHFFPPHNDKLVSKLPEIIPTVDILLGNLEDAIPMADKEAARHGLVQVAKTVPMGDTQLWTRINSLDSPWALDDLTTLVTEVGDKIDVVMVPKVEGPEDIHYVDRLLAQLEAKAKLDRPILVHAILETARGVANIEAICGASPRMQGLSLGPADLAANRRMKTTATLTSSSTRRHSSSPTTSPKAASSSIAAPVSVDLPPSSLRTCVDTRACRTPKRSLSSRRSDLKSRPPTCSRRRSSDGLTSTSWRREGRDSKAATRLLTNGPRRGIVHV